MYNMCSDLRFELENVKEERDNAVRKVTRFSGAERERERERLMMNVLKKWSGLQKIAHEPGR